MLAVVGVDVRRHQAIHRTRERSVQTIDEQRFEHGALEKDISLAGEGVERSRPGSIPIQPLGFGRGLLFLAWTPDAPWVSGVVLGFAPTNGASPCRPWVSSSGARSERPPSGPGASVSLGCEPASRRDVNATLV